MKKERLNSIRTRLRSLGTVGPISADPGRLAVLDAFVVQSF